MQGAMLAVLVAVTGAAPEPPADGGPEGELIALDGGPPAPTEAADAGAPVSTGVADAGAPVPTDPPWGTGAKRFELYQTGAYGMPECCREVSFSDGTTGVRVFLPKLAESATVHRRAVEFLDHPSTLTLGLGRGGLFLDGLLFFSSASAVYVGLSTPMQPLQVVPQIGLLHYFTRNWRAGFGTSMTLGAGWPRDLVVGVSLATALLVGPWLASLELLWKHWSYLDETAARQGSNAPTVLLRNQLFITRRLAATLSLDASVGWQRQLDLTAPRADTRLVTIVGADWEWTRWLTTGLTFNWHWFHAANRHPTYWLGGGLEVRVRL